MTSRPLPPVKGMWSIPVDIKCTESQKEFVESETRKVLAKLGPGIELPEAHIEDLHAEWQAVRRVPEEKSARWTREEQYAELATDMPDSPVILYLHGGAYIVCSIDTHRPLTAKLAEVSNARVFIVSYRLAPQHQFPAALLDAILAYKYLIDPPPGALHTAVDPKKIVIAGDSAGVYLSPPLSNLGWFSICLDGIPRSCSSSFPITRRHNRNVAMAGLNSFIPFSPK